MRTQHLCPIAVAAAMTLIVPPPATARQSDAKATEIIAAARKALGGEQKLASVKALSLKGTYRREPGAAAPGGGGQMVFMVGPGAGPGGSSQISGEIEIDTIFPDKYLKVDTQTGIAAITRSEGFDGDRPLLSVQSNSPHVRIMADSPNADPGRVKVALDRARAELARLLLGMMAAPQPGFTVTYSYVGPAEAPDGKAEAVDVKGPDGFAARLFVDAETHVPLMLTYTAPEPRVITRMSGPGERRGEPRTRTNGTRLRTPADLSPEERERLEKERQALEAEPPKIVEHRIFFSDFRNVNGVSLPHRITRGTAAATTEEWEIRSYKVNPSIKPERFTVS
jgi:hypothetical protein